ncbi:YqaE/Pmp3 family membrane protein [Vreelandella venusta]|uniref:YqaE/Pmp3 family membrane protein n=1 Tax=Vreelandella venusta TaxID=44935 RepID=UPI00384FFB0C
MDAREYLNRQGVGLDRDQERPNTLEEKAWERARGAGSHRPKSGTPHDWEDWEEHHGDLAEGAETLEQKIDKEAHRKALAHEKAKASLAQSSVEHFTPPATPSAQQSAAVKSDTSLNPKPISEPASLQFAYRALAVLLPPLAVGLTGGGAKRIVVSLLLTLLAWLPGVIYAFNWLKQR